MVMHSEESGIPAGRTIAGRIVKWWGEVRHLKEIDRRQNADSSRWDAGGTKHGSQCHSPRYGRSTKIRNSRITLVT